jgi:hypothetical protein
MEPTEVEEFTKQMSEGGESGMRTISLAISVLAVLVAMVTVMGHRTHTEAVLTQEDKTDQWNLYQAKKIREVQYSTAAQVLSTQPNSGDSKVQHDIADDLAKVDKAKKDADAAQESAKESEHEVNLAERRANRYDLSEALLQIAVVLSSITLLTRQKAYFGLGLLLGVLGIILAASALLVH